MTKLHFRVGEIEAARALVIAYHYSARWPGNVQFVGTWHGEGGLFGDRGECLAACFFSIPPTRWSHPVLELSRLVRSPLMRVSLSGLIAATCQHIKKQNAADLLVSFADPTHGHHGGIYQASSWKYAGRRERRMDGLLINGVFTPGRSCNSIYGTQSPAKLAAILPGHALEPHYDEGKHLYWRALGRSGEKKAQMLGLQSLPYPKPAMASVGVA